MYLLICSFDRSAGCRSSPNLSTELHLCPASFFIINLNRPKRFGSFFSFTIQSRIYGLVVFDRQFSSSSHVEGFVRRLVGSWEQSFGVEYLRISYLIGFAGSSYISEHLLSWWHLPVNRERNLDFDRGMPLFIFEINLNINVYLILSEY